jgi:hypothetical protein
MAKRTKPGTAPVWREDSVIPAHIVRAIHPYDVGLQRWVRNALEAKRKPHKPSLKRAFREAKNSDVGAPTGRPREHDYASIIATAEEIAEDGAPDHQAWFIEKVRDLLHARHVKVPKLTQLKKIIGPIYRRAKAAPLRSR